MSVLDDKVRLLLGGDVRLQEGFSHENIVFRDGVPFSAVLGFGGTRVRKRISPDGQFLLEENKGKIRVLDGEEIFIEDAEIVRMYGHSPETVTISISGRNGFLTVPESLEIMESYKGMDPMKGATIHGERGCPLDLYAETVRAYREKYPDLPLGAALPVPDPEGIRTLKDAGAVNFKTSVRKPEDFTEAVWEGLRESADIFGKGMVTCGIHIDENTDDAVLERILDRMCSLGVMPDIKVWKSEVTGKKEVSAGRYCGILRRSKEIMEKYGLDASG